MLMENAVTPNFTGAPVSTGVTYVADQLKIDVPVYLDSEGKVFAPPFLVPKGTWKIVYDVKSPDLVFESVIYYGVDHGHNLPAGVCIKDNGNPAEQTKWTTMLENNVTEVNMLGSTIHLKTPDSESSRADKRNHHVRHHYKGDPTITVVKDPIDG
jgi:hypothetical protein